VNTPCYFSTFVVVNVRAIWLSVSGEKLGIAQLKTSIAKYLKATTASDECCLDEKSKIADDTERDVSHKPYYYHNTIAYLN
jgi:hypothetical protein